MITVPLVGEEDQAQANTIARNRSWSASSSRGSRRPSSWCARAWRSAASTRSPAGAIVLTGGASQLAGVRELAQLVLDKQVRMGRPIRIAGLAEATGGPAFAVAAGPHRLCPAGSRPTRAAATEGACRRIGAATASSADSETGSGRTSDVERRACRTRQASPGINAAGIDRRQHDSTSDNGGRK